RNIHDVHCIKSLFNSLKSTICDKLVSNTWNREKLDICLSIIGDDIKSNIVSTYRGTVRDSTICIIHFFNDSKIGKVCSVFIKDSNTVETALNDAAELG